MRHFIAHDRLAPLAIAIATLTVAIAPAQAQETTLGTVVVTAASHEQDVKDAPASISVITREELDKKPYANLREVLSGLEGVSVVGYSASETDIMIRGMPAEYRCSSWTASARARAKP